MVSGYSGRTMAGCANCASDREDSVGGTRIQMISHAIVPISPTRLPAEESSLNLALNSLYLR